MQGSQKEDLPISSKHGLKKDNEWFLNTEAIKKTIPIGAFQDG